VPAWISNKYVLGYHGWRETILQALSWRARANCGRHERRRKQCLSMLSSLVTLKQFFLSHLCQKIDSTSQHIAHKLEKESSECVLLLRFTALFFLSRFGTDILINWKKGKRAVWFWSVSRGGYPDHVFFFPRRECVVYPLTRQKEPSPKSWSSINAALSIESIVGAKMISYFTRAIQAHSHSIK